MKRMKLSRRFISLLLCVAMLAAYIPFSLPLSMVSAASIEGSYIDVDPGSADSWESMLGTGVDGNRYAGRVWADRSVYENGQTVKLNSRGEYNSQFTVSLEDDEVFQVIFSVLGSSMTTTTTTSSTGPMDVVLVMDTSTSMDDTVGGITRLERVITAANALIDDLLTIKNVRIAVVTYNYDSDTVIPLDFYENGLDLVVTNYYDNGRANAGVVFAYDDNDALLGQDDGFNQGTNLQAGIDRGFNILSNADNVEGRVPVAIVLTDGQANRLNQDSWHTLPNSGSYDYINDERMVLSTILNAAYNKAKVEEHYGREQRVYSIGVDLGTSSEAHPLMNPGATTNGFNANNGYTAVEDAYNYYLDWANGETVRIYSEGGWGSGPSWTIFDHDYPTMNGAITRQDIINNINYVSPNSYYDVSSADLSETFEQIYEELSSGVFNPISDSTTVEGSTSVDNTPLIYVDFIGQHMEIKEITHVTVFGASYSVVDNGDGTYTVAAATGTNPTTNELWSTSDHIKITVTDQADGTQKLEIRINQEILPIILSQVVSNTVGEETTATITEFIYDPLRIYYTVGMDPDVLLPNGEIDVTKILGYTAIDDTNGTASFYSNQFGVMNPADSNNVVLNGDAHVGFMPSAENRYYYHPANQGVYSAVSSVDNSPIDWDESEYGVLYEIGKFNLTYLTYEEYLTKQDDDQVYTYVKYYRPTESQTDAANAAEEVTYLVYTDWGYLKESIAFYDHNAGVFINYDATNGYVTGDVGYAADPEDVEAMIAAYKADNPDADIKAMLGVGSLRTSRLHNMERPKDDNISGTAVNAYAPTYTTEEGAATHNDNDVVIWLGNNGRYTVPIDTGIALTKNVTEAIGSSDDTYALTVTVPAGVVATPSVVDSNGNNVTASISTYENNVLTVNLKAGETVYISGIPGGTECAIGEIIPNGAEYYIDSQDTGVTIPTLSQVLDATNPVAQYVPAQVTNAPYKHGNLYITKEISSDHTIPQSILDKEFEITVNVGTGLSGEVFDVRQTNAADTQATVDAAGNMVFTIKAGQTIEILELPAGTRATITETAPGGNFAVTYRTRNHSGETPDNDNVIIIPEGGNSTAVITNEYTPYNTTVDLDVNITKNFTMEGSHAGGSFTFKVQQWNGSAWEDIAGKTAQTVYVANESGTKTAIIEDVLAGITYTEVGSWAYQVLEVKGSVANVTYDRTLYTFTVTVTDNGGQLVATVTDVNNTVISGSYDVEFNNAYHTAPVSIDIIKEIINNSGDSSVSKAGFDFRAVRTDSSWNALTGADASELTVSSDAAGEARITATYKLAGTYYYVLTEVNEAVPGWTYSAAEYRVTVVVQDVGGGDMKATLSIEKVGSTNANETATVDALDATNATVVFSNTYDPADVTVNLDGNVAKELTGKELVADMFTFYVYRDGDRTTPILVGTNDLNGNVRFVDFEGELIFNTVGTYRYDIIEEIPAGAVIDAASGKYVLDGMYYDATIYDLVIEIRNDASTGTLVATYYFEDSVDDTVVFHNRYVVSEVDYQLAGTKILNGRALTAGEFAFELYHGNTLLETVKNRANGSFQFSNITYKAAGTYVYTIKEVSGNIAGVIYDGVNNPITVTVTVTDTNGVLSASADISNTDIVFENTYNPAPATVTFTGNKKLEGGTLTDNMFTFRLYSTDSSFDIKSASAKLVASAKNINGAFELATESFATAGNYFYVIVEDSTDNTIDNIVYDRTEYRVRVRVRDVGDGQLRVSVTDMATNVSSTPAASTIVVASFKNATFEEAVEKEVYYAGDTTTLIDGGKVNVGDRLTYFITYTNHTGADVLVDIKDTIPAYTSYVDGSASHGGVYAATYLSWSLNVAKGASVTVAFDVVVTEAEAIVTNTAVIRDGVNTYTTNEVTNHTFENGLKKDVFYPEDLSTSIDGKKVYEGEELVYKIVFTNASADTVDIVIKDNVPDNTIYIKESNLEGEFEKGTLTWDIKDVPAWSSVTVSFKVRVKAGVGAVTIENKATATDGYNNYETETVSNYTVEDNVEKDVFAESDLTTSIDGKKVYVGDVLVYTISYENKASETATINIEDIIPEYTTYVEGSGDNGAAYANGVITWEIDVPAGETVTVSFKVKVNSDAKNVTIRNKATVIEGKNSYDTETVNNYTVEDEVSKDVFAENDYTVSIDGKKVYVGDVLVYTISYTNGATENATVEIKDIIPEYTTYVDGSADKDGVFADGAITWTVDVPAGETVTVSFKVKVNDDAKSVTIENKATLIEGKNSYETETVSNYTVEDEVSKDVFAESDLTVSIDGKKVYVGDVLVYTISYTNGAKEDATVEIKDIIPEYTTYVDGSADNDGVFADGAITWNIDVAAGETVTVSFKVKVNGDAKSVTITNKAPVIEGRNSYVTNEVSNYTVEDEVEKDVFAESDLTVSIDGKKVYVGDVLVYTISYTNTAKESATVEIKDIIPEYTTYVEGSADNNGVFADGAITWKLDVAAGETVTVSFKVQVNSDASSVTIANKAAAIEGRNSYETNEVTNYTVYDEVDKQVAFEPDASVNIDGKKVYVGDVLVYTISYTNGSNEKATVEIKDIIPECTTYVEGSSDKGGAFANGVITWSLEVEPGETVTVSFKVVVNEGTKSASITNKATITEGKNTYETNEVTNYTAEDEVEKDVFAESDMTVSIDGDKVYVGDVLVYTITYKNNAREDSTVEIKDIIPAYTTYVEGSADNNGVFADGTITWNIVVPAGEATTVSFKVIVNSDATNVTITNKATAVEGRSTYETNEVTNYTIVDEVSKDVFAESDLTVSIDGKEVMVGDILVYTIKYKNLSKDAANVTIKDSIPQYTSYVEGSIDNGGIFADGEITWTLEVDAGAEVTVSFKVKVEGEGNVVITNEADVLEGRNSYLTNEVTNPTKTPDIPHPPTSDGNNIWLWMTLLFVSGAGFAGVKIYKKKQMETENA